MCSPVRDTLSEFRGSFVRKTSEGGKRPTGIQPMSGDVRRNPPKTSSEVKPSSRHRSKITDVPHVLSLYRCRSIPIIETQDDVVVTSSGVFIFDFKKNGRTCAAAHSVSDVTASTTSVRLPRPLDVVVTHRNTFPRFHGDKIKKRPKKKFF